MTKLVILCLCSLLACVTAQRITTIQLDGVQYFISRMNPYSPELNYFLAYQYCRSLGLQLASFETKEKVESMTQYLQNAGYSKYDFWTSGNRLGTGMFLWMSTGLPFNATFDFFENSAEVARSGILDPVDHNSNTAPQRTARDSNSGLEKGCVMLKAPTLKWMPEDCSTVKDFICEQTRCYYYNYGSIPVSSAQGRPIISSTTYRPSFSTTPLPSIFSSTFSTFLRKTSDDHSQEISDTPRTASKIPNEDHNNIVKNENEKLKTPDDILNKHNNENNNSNEYNNNNNNNSNNNNSNDDHNTSVELDINDNNDDITEHNENEESRHLHDDENDYEHNNHHETVNNEEHDNISDLNNDNEDYLHSSELPSVEQRLKQISQEIEKLGGVDTNNDSEIGHQSFLSLSDLIKTLRPNEKKIPQIDSDYSNTMRVLGESSLLIGNDESRKSRNAITSGINRSSA